MDNLNVKPLRREADLVVQEMSASHELLVYDLEDHRAYALNPVMAAVWRACDGTRTVPELAAALPDEARAPSPLQHLQIRRALTRLHALRLLEQPLELPRSLRCTRRQVTGLAAVLIPAVTTLLAPSAAEAGSLLPNGSSCSDGQQCAGGLCIGGTCGGLAP